MTIYCIGIPSWLLLMAKTNAFVACITRFTICSARTCVLLTAQIPYSNSSFAQHIPFCLVAHISCLWFKTLVPLGWIPCLSYLTSPYLQKVPVVKLLLSSCQNSKSSISTGWFFWDFHHGSYQSWINTSKPANNTRTIVNQWSCRIGGRPLTSNGWSSGFHCHGS